MKYYSTNRATPVVDLEEVVVKGLAADRGLFMPETIRPLHQRFLTRLTGSRFMR